jgi:hypothetical protein
VPGWVEKALRLPILLTRTPWQLARLIGFGEQEAAKQCPSVKAVIFPGKISAPIGRTGPLWRNAADSVQVGDRRTPGGARWKLLNDLDRLRVRREDMGDGSAAEDGGAHRLDGEWREEDPLARTQDDRVDDKAVLVYQAGLDQRPGESYSAVGE